MFVNQNNRRNAGWARRATIMTQTVVFGSLVGVGVAALAVDTGLMYSAKAELQNAADAAALAAASQLGVMGNFTEAALQEAARLAAANKIAGSAGQMLSADLVLGHATPNGDDSYTFHPNELPQDAVKVTLRRDQQVTDGPVSLAFGRMLGVNSAKMTASAVAMVAPRDVTFVVDLSSNMNNDSQLQHYTTYQNHDGNPHNGVQINTEDVWVRLPKEKGNNGVGNGIDPPPPGNPTNLNDQPGTGPGSPASKGGNPNPGANPTGGSSNQSGPRWGWMTGYGDSLTLDAYNPATDTGLYYIPRYNNTNDADVLANLSEASYAPPERNALKNASDDSDAAAYRNRVKVMLGLAGWKSGKNNAKYSTGGNGDNKIDAGEITQEVSFPIGSGSWDDYINYVMSDTSRMYQTDPSLRYRYGIKTVVNYLLETQSGPNGTSDLKDAPEMPLSAVRSAVRRLIDRMIDNNYNDHVSLVTYSRTGHLEVTLSNPQTGESLTPYLLQVPQTLEARRAGYYDKHANLGAGLEQAIAELTSSRARPNAKKVIVLLTNGRPDTDATGAAVGTDHESARSWALEQASVAKNLGITVYCVGVGEGVDGDFLKEVASSPSFCILADGEADPDNHGLPAYTAQLDSILENLGSGTNRPVRLIQ